MSTESMSERREHIRSISVTALAAFAGVGAALLSASIIGTSGDPNAIASDVRAYVIVFVAITLQLLLLRGTGIYSDEEFGIKHNLFITFMTFSFWFVTWGIILTTQVQ